MRPGAHGYLLPPLRASRRPAGDDTDRIGSVLADIMWKHLFGRIDIPKENVNILNGNAPDLEAECAGYEERIKKIGGIRLFVGARVKRAYGQRFSLERLDDARQDVQHCTDRPRPALTLISIGQRSRWGTDRTHRRTGNGGKT